MAYSGHKFGCLGPVWGPTQSIRDTSWLSPVDIMGHKTRLLNPG